VRPNIGPAAAGPAGPCATAQRKSAWDDQLIHSCSVLVTPLSTRKEPITNDCLSAGVTISIQQIP